MAINIINVPQRSADEIYRNVLCLSVSLSVPTNGPLLPTFNIRNCNNSLKYLCGLLKTCEANFSYAPFLSRETGKVVLVLSFNRLRIHINTVCRKSYVISMLRHFLDKIK